jgi:hypothetical protein
VDVSDELARLAFDEAQRALDKQDEALRELRARTGILLAASALVASFLGSRALAEGDVPWLTIPGLVTAIVTIVSSVLVITPRSAVTFALHGPALYEHLLPRTRELADAHRTLAYWIQEAWDRNQAVIDGLIRTYQLASAALVLEVVLWSLELAID